MKLGPGHGHWPSQFSLNPEGHRASTLICNLTGQAFACAAHSQLYVPSIPGMPDTSHITPESYGLDSEEVEVETQDGIRLHAWLLMFKQWTSEELRSRPVILFFQVCASYSMMTDGKHDFSR